LIDRKDKLALITVFLLNILAIASQINNAYWWLLYRNTYNLIFMILPTLIWLPLTTYLICILAVAYSKHKTINQFKKHK